MRIVNVASVTGPVVTIEGTAGYSAAKAAMTGLTRATALENAGLCITCNAVLPGWIATGSATAREIAAGKRSPTGRPGRPGEVASACVFLASEEASYINGTSTQITAASFVVGDAVVGTQKTLTTALTTSDVNYTVGSASDLWGYAITPALLNTSTTGFAISCTGVGISNTARVDAMWITVDYMLPGPVLGYINRKKRLLASLRGGLD